MKLPVSSHLPVHLLASCFNYRSATYKYYWFLSILELLEKGESVIPKRRIFASMIANSWYTVNYFHLSFGQLDKLQTAIKLIRDVEHIPIDENRDVIVEVLTSSSNKATLNTLNYFDRQVPHWFLSPWFPKETNVKRIYSATQVFENKALYALHRDFIEINPEWENYLRENVGILKDFCYWNLAIFLQSRNPNVPDIPNKLIKPAVRNNLTKQRREFWDIVIGSNGPQECIYTHKQLSLGDYAVEHFIPYAFVSHDLIWNLIPADKSFNSSKGDRIPRFETHFTPFVELQLKGVHTVREVKPDNRYLQEYLTIFPDLSVIGNLPEQAIRERFQHVIQPLITIALNNGFEYMPDEIQRRQLSVL